MKKGRFLWSAHRITERQKAGKARSIKGKQLKNSRNTVLKQLVEHHSSQRDNQVQFSNPQNPCVLGICSFFRLSKIVQNSDGMTQVCHTV